MSINSNSAFKKFKTPTSKNMPIFVKPFEAPLFSIQSTSLPKKIDYTKKNFDLSSYFGGPSENIVLHTNDLFTIERKIGTNYDSEENLNNGSSSNLPTANNSFSCNFNSPERLNTNQDEYQDVSPFNTSRRHSNPKLTMKKTLDEENECNEINNSLSNSANNHTPISKKSEDFKVKYKTEICKFWDLHKFCKYGDNCAFAHGSVDKRSKLMQANSYRTRKCRQFFENGFCPYGNRCQFAHALKCNTSKNGSDLYFSYKKSIKLLSQAEEYETIKSVMTRPRLTIFENLHKSVNINSSLINDLKNLKNELENEKELKVRPRVFSF